MAITLHQFAALTTTALALWCVAAPAAYAQAQQPTLDKIKASGKAVLGVREASPPMAYMLGAQDKYVGYHVEHVSEVRMAVRADSDIKSISQLGGRNVAASTGTTAVQMLRKQERAVGAPINVLLGKDHAESFLLLETGRVDAFVLDDNLLAGVIASSKNPAGFRIVGETMGSEPIALLFRKDDPTFKAAVDGVLTKLMQSGEVEKIYNKWFVNPIPPKNVSLNLPMGDTLKGLIANPNDKPLETYLK